MNNMETGLNNPVDEQENEEIQNMEQKERTHEEREEVSKIDEDLERIHEEYGDAFFIGVIGTTFVDEKTALFCRALGYRIRANMEEWGDSYVYTGGVLGVGENIHRGVSSYVFDNDEAERRDFKVLPDYNFKRDDVPENAIKIEPIGKDMHDRRIGIAKLASVVIAVQGGPGTEHELKTALEYRKPVILCYGHGGITDQYVKGMDVLVPEEAQSSTYVATNMDEVMDLLRDIRQDYLNTNITGE